MNRRRTLKLMSSLPIVALFPSLASADAKALKKVKDAAKKAAPKKAKGGMALISEKDTLANAMQYRHDASKAPAMRTNKKAFCNNCSKYNVCMDGDKTCKPLSAKALKAATQGPCQIFKGKAVADKGWCLSWQAKA